MATALVAIKLGKFVPPDPSNTERVKLNWQRNNGEIVELRRSVNSNMSGYTVITSFISGPTFTLPKYETATILQNDDTTFYYQVVRTGGAITRTPNSNILEVTIMNVQLQDIVVDALNEKLQLQDIVVDALNEKLQLQDIVVDALNEKVLLWDIITSQDSYFAQIRILDCEGLPIRQNLTIAVTETYTPPLFQFTPPYIVNQGGTTVINSLPVERGTDGNYYFPYRVTNVFQLAEYAVTVTTPDRCPVSIPVVSGHQFTLAGTVNDNLDQQIVPLATWQYTCNGSLTVCIDGFCIPDSGPHYTITGPGGYNESGFDLQEGSNCITRTCLAAGIYTVTVFGAHGTISTDIEILDLP